MKIKNILITVFIFFTYNIYACSISATYNAYNPPPYLFISNNKENVDDFLVHKYGYNYSHFANNFNFVEIYKGFDGGKGGYSPAMVYFNFKDIPKKYNKVEIYAQYITHMPMTYINGKRTQDWKNVEYKFSRVATFENFSSVDKIRNNIETIGVSIKKIIAVFSDDKEYKVNTQNLRISEYCSGHDFVDITFDKYLQKENINLKIINKPLKTKLRIKDNKLLFGYLAHREYGLSESYITNLKTKPISYEITKYPQVKYIDLFDRDNRILHITPYYFITHNSYMIYFKNNLQNASIKLYLKNGKIFEKKPKK